MDCRTYILKFQSLLCKTLLNAIPFLFADVMLLIEFDILTMFKTLNTLFSLIKMNSKVSKFRYDVVNVLMH